MIMKSKIIFGLPPSLLLIGATSLALPFQGHQIVISGPSPYAIDVGKKIYQDGGNVIDVAVGVGLTLSVTSPYFAALGGGGLALVKMNNQIEALDFRETAPQATFPDYYLRKVESASRDGGAAVGVPGFVAGLWALHQRFGKLKWARLFDEPLKLAQDGFQVSGEWVESTDDNVGRMNQAGVDAFTKGKKPYLPGEVLKQKKLFDALTLLKKHGAKAFYDGEISKDIVSTIKKTGGEMSLDDLKNYSVRWLEPFRTLFHGHTVYLMPPPSSGGIIIQTALRLIEKLKMANHKPLSVDELHLFAEIMSRSFRGRSLLGDPDFHKNPSDFLLSEKYISSLVHSLSIKKHKPLKPLNENPIGNKKESAQTTHYCVLDVEGHAISLTVTLNDWYGSAVVSEKYAIALNNEMDDFTTLPDKPNMFGLIQGRANQVDPRKRPLSSMSPTLVEKQGHAVMSLGAPGGPRIVNGVLQVLYRVLMNGWDIDQAIQTPRVHHQFLPDKLFVDERRFAPETLAGLTRRGHVVIADDSIARVYGVRVNSKGWLEAAFDSRGEGGAGGY